MFNVLNFHFHLLLALYFALSFWVGWCCTNELVARNTYIIALAYCWKLRLFVLLPPPLVMFLTC